MPHVFLGIENKNLFPTVLEVEKSENQVVADSVFRESILTCRRLPSCCTRREENLMTSSKDPITLSARAWTSEWIWGTYQHGYDRLLAQKWEKPLITHNALLLYILAWKHLLGVSSYTNLVCFFLWGILSSQSLGSFLGFWIETTTQDSEITSTLRFPSCSD